jgi:protein phosphatase 2C family protein 2/3
MWGESLRKATEAELYEQAPAPKRLLASDEPLPNYEESKVAVRPTGSVTFFGASTNRGIERAYNEDRVSIILNIIKPESRADETWPYCSFFGLFDGHGGTACADFLRDNLHQYVVRQKAFPFDPREAIRRGFLEAEQAFLQHCEETSELSGSCAIVLLVVGQDCYIANVGDSRALLSCYGGESTVNLSRDHKPTDPKEQKRILEAAGKVFITYCETMNEERSIAKGPLRIFPGRLSLTRSFGDIEAKVARLGGNPRVLISLPEITSFRIDHGHEMILLGCDGVFDCLKSE